MKTPHSPLLTGERSYIPCNVVAPADGLHPVDGSSVEPDQVSGTLDEAIDGHVGLVQVLQVGPPRAHQEVDVIPEMRGRDTPWSTDLLHVHFADRSQQVSLFTEVTHHAPVRFGDGEPFTVSWADVDVDSTEVVVFLVA